MICDYIDKLLILVCTGTGYISIYVFDFLIAIENASIELTVCVTAAGLKEYKSGITKKEKNMTK